MKISNFILNKSGQIPPLRIFLLVCVLCSVFCVLDVKAEPKVPEKLTYSVYWSGIKAGSASLEVENTPEGIRIMSRATSAPVISIFYKVEDIAQSILYPDGYPSSYILKISEGKHR
ncbi:MAG: DUF3108 domain-containing protein, partial [Thermodesulfovibrionia bacterium]|nr:DUF3108 domain-containing protein [Thermodesulfovibrionia bacterium]